MLHPFHDPEMRSTTRGSSHSAPSSGAVTRKRIFISPRAGTGKHCTITVFVPAVVTSTGSLRGTTAAEG